MHKLHLNNFSMFLHSIFTLICCIALKRIAYRYAHKNKKYIIIKILFMTHQYHNYV